MSLYTGSAIERTSQNAIRTPTANPMMRHTRRICTDLLECESNEFSADRDDEVARVCARLRASS
jgi:hypothetical protein